MTAGATRDRASTAGQRAATRRRAASERVRVCRRTRSSRPWRSLARGRGARRPPAVAGRPTPSRASISPTTTARVGLRRVGGAWTFATPEGPVRGRHARRRRMAGAPRHASRRRRRSAGAQRAPPDRRRALSPGRSTSSPRPRSTRCSRPIRSASASAPCCRSRTSTCAAFSAPPASHTAVGDDGRRRQLARAAGEPVDARQRRRVVAGALVDLRAEAFLAATPPPGAPTARLEIDVKPPGEPRPLRHVVAASGREATTTAWRAWTRDATFKTGRARRATRSAWTC